MAFLVQENPLSICSCDNDFNNALLMSFLEESPSEEYDHKEVDSLMRSLEAVVNPNPIDIQDLMIDLESLSDGEESHGSNLVDLDFQCGDLEPVPSPSPSRDRNWHMDAMIEIGDDYFDISFDDALHGLMVTASITETNAIEMWS